MWPHMTDDNIKGSLRGETSAAYTTNVSSIYRAIDDCYIATNRLLLSGELQDRQYFFGPTYPIILANGTSNYNRFPAEYPPGNVGSVNPLGNTCHWNLPVIDLMASGVRHVCQNVFSGDANNPGFTFRDGDKPPPVMTISGVALWDCPIGETRQTDRTMYCCEYLQHRAAGFLNRRHKRNALTR